jgi:hypothetical protein
MTTDNELLAEEALDAFWNVIVQKFPEATSGDLSPLATFQLDQAAEAAVKEWVQNNVHDAHLDDATTATAFWCTCPEGTGFADPFYIPDNWCQCGEQKHHWHCGHCKGIVQVG